MLIHLIMQIGKHKQLEISYSIEDHVFLYLIEVKDLEDGLAQLSGTEEFMDTLLDLLVSINSQLMVKFITLQEQEEKPLKMEDLLLGEEIKLHLVQPEKKLTQFLEELISIYMQDQMQLQVKFLEFALIKWLALMLSIILNMDILHTQDITIVQEELISLEFVKEEVSKEQLSITVFSIYAYICQKELLWDLKDKLVEKNINI